MKQDFNIIRIETSMDMGIGNRSKGWQCIDEENIASGDVFDVYDNDLTIVSIDEVKMVFKYVGGTYTINRHWQVLGTPELNIPNERISKQCRYICFYNLKKKMVKAAKMTIIDYKIARICCSL